MIFKEEMQKSRKDRCGNPNNKYSSSTKEFCQYLKREYDSLKEEERSRYE